MKISRHLFAGLALTTFAFATPASAHNLIQGDGSMQLGATTISVGAGTAILDLPDVQFLKTIPAVAFGQTVSSRTTDADDFSDEIGWNINGEISAPIGGNRLARQP